MRSWNAPTITDLPTAGPLPRLTDTATGEQHEVTITDGSASLYVCGITPYDATHLGHANTYLAYDTLVRVLRDADVTVEYVQNVTDIDDPLLERATATGVDWRELAEQQTELFRSDMEQLRILPPTHYVGVVESIDDIARAVTRLRDAGLAYQVPSDGAEPDWYFDIAAAEQSTPWHLGKESNLDRATMIELFAERGGDPDRRGKRDQLDPLLWRAERPDEPAWDSPLGRGRPGWHIECSVIGLERLTAPISINGGGRDLIFPHHEFSAAHATALAGTEWAHTFTHSGFVALDGTKMSKSLGNLEFVSRLTARGADGAAIRLALLSHHYRDDWEWTADQLDTATTRLGTWRDWASTATGESGSLLALLRDALADDLDTPAAIAAVDAVVASGAPATLTDVAALDALLGIDVSS